MGEKPPKDFHVEDADDSRGGSAAKPTNSRERDHKRTDKPDVPVVKFRNRPQPQGSNKMTLLIGGAALVIVIILLLKLF